MFHKHKWVEVERFYAEPVVGKLKGVSPDEAERMLMGVTTIRSRCNCGDYKNEEILGNSQAVT